MYSYIYYLWRKTHHLFKQFESFPHMILFTIFGWNLPSSFEEEVKIVKRIDCCQITDEQKQSHETQIQAN